MRAISTGALAQRRADAHLRSSRAPPTRAKKQNYSEPMIGWNDEDNHTGVTTYGVCHYEGTAKLKISAPARPALLPPPDEASPIPGPAGLQVTWPVIM